MGDAGGIYQGGVRVVLASLGIRWRCYRVEKTDGNRVWIVLVYMGF